MEIPATLSEATFRRLLLLALGINADMIPPILSTAEFRRLAVQGIGSVFNSLPQLSPPSSLTDFTMFPGNVVPASGQYIAFDTLNIYTIKGSDTAWFSTPR